MPAPKVETTHDPVIQRYRAHCPFCPYIAVRAKSEAAVHAVANHAAYEHGKEVRP